MAGSSIGSGTTVATTSPLSLPHAPLDFKSVIESSSGRAPCPPTPTFPSPRSPSCYSSNTPSSSSVATLATRPTSSFSRTSSNSSPTNRVSPSYSSASRQAKEADVCALPLAKKRPRSYTQLERPTAFLITPLRSSVPASGSTPSSPSLTSKTASHHTHPHALAQDQDRNRGRARDGERPTRSSSSPQLIRYRTRARSSSASSSASLTATEESFSYAYERASASTSTSSARFPSTLPYPPAWPFSAGPSSSQARISASGPTSSSTLNLRNRRFVSGETTVSSPSEEDSELDSEGLERDDMIFVSPANGISGSGARLRRRKEEELLRVVTTARGQPCAGETETELDEIPTRLPTSRKIPASEPLIILPITTIVNYLFQACRLLSVVPAVFGTMYNIHHAFYPPKPVQFQKTSIDYVVCALWAILTGFQCLRLTTGLLHRWKAYYATLSTFIRLIALQGICWPATHLTLKFFDHNTRPVACWALIGTTTCISRSVQLWVTSNLYLPPSKTTVEGDMVRRGEGKLGPRRWDWRQVGKKCVLPAGILYFITAWAMILKSEFRDC